MSSPTARRPCLTVLTLVALPLVAGCLSKPVTKDEAGKLVNTSAAFTRPKFAHIPRQLTFSGNLYSPAANGTVLSITDLAKVDPTLAILRGARVVNLTESIYGAERGATHQLTVTPTGIDSTVLLADEDPEAGASDQLDGLSAGEEHQRLVSAGWTNFNKEIGWRVQIGTRRFVQVEQIHNWRDVNENIPVNELAVDFTWRWMPNEFGEPFDSGSETFRSLPDDVQEAAKNWGVRMNTEVNMRSRAYLYRDGNRWQLRSIQWQYGRGNPR